MLNGLRYLHMDPEEINRMTFFEYRMRMQAASLQVIDAEYMVYLQAWANREVQATKKKGKNKQVYVYSTMKQFFDREKLEKEILTDEEPQEPSGLAKRLMDYERGKKRGEL